MPKRSKRNKIPLCRLPFDDLEQSLDRLYEALNEVLDEVEAGDRRMSRLNGAASEATAQRFPVTRGEG